MVTAEIQLTNQLGRQAAQEDLIGLSYALAQVLHLSLANVRVTFGPVTGPPASYSPPSQQPTSPGPPSHAPEAAAPSPAAPVRTVPAPPPVEPLGPLRCNPNAPPPPDREDTAADVEAMAAPGEGRPLSCCFACLQSFLASTPS